MVNIISDYIPPFSPLPNIAPFTYKDGETYLSTLENLRNYFNTTVVEFINTNFTSLSESFTTEVNTLIDQVEVRLTEQNTDVTTQLADLTSYVNEQVALVIDNSIDINDVMAAQLVNNVASAIRLALDAIYLTPTDAANTYVDKATFDVVANTYVNTDTFNALKDVSDTGRLSDAELTTKVDSQVAAGLSVERAKYWLTPADFGAVGDGITDDKDALISAMAAQVPLYWGSPDKNYRIDGFISHMLTKDLMWRSDGAKVFINPSNGLSVATGIQINSNGHNVNIDGPLIMDCNMLAFTGWDFISTSLTYANFYAKGLGVKNVYRKDQTKTGGTGIKISGGFDSLILDHPYVKNVVMAAGAGISGNQGIQGILIKASSAGICPVSISINDPYINGIWCQDPAYFMDQDGISIFTNEDNGSISLFDTHFIIRGGTIMNSRGRGIKSQCEFGTVDGVKFVRDADQVPGIYNSGIMPEVDFQVGGGNITNCEARYYNSTPATLVKWSGTRQVGGKETLGLSIRGFKVSYTGVVGWITNFLVAVMEEQLHPMINISDVTVFRSTGTLMGDFMTLSGTNVTFAYVTIKNCSANLKDSTARVFYRAGGSTVTVYLSVFDFIKNRTAGTNATISAVGTAGNITVVTGGNLVRVV